MRILDSARKHGVADDDILHAWRNCIRVFDEDALRTYIGPSRTGIVLEIGMVVDDEPRIVHAMQARRKYIRRL